MKTSSIAAVQYGIGPLRSENEFWNRIRRHVAKAQTQGAGLIVFPEYLTGHLLSLASAMNNEQACEYLHRFTDEYKSRFVRMSRETGLMILAGTHIHREGAPSGPSGAAAYYNEAFLFFPDGRIEGYKKIHLTPEERRAWPLLAGDRYTVLDTEMGRIAMQICYDIEFPESTRIVADMGAEIILCPSYTDAAAGYWRVRHCSQARAVENQLYVVLSGLVGQMPGVEQVDAGYCQAGVFAPCDKPFPDNGIIAVGSPNRNGLVTGAADLALLAQNRAEGGVSPFYDRRPELYASAATRLPSS
ncbi:carbon-nitrogen hydrolase family protein [Paenibacillus hodogayensis]|uniref:Carbon-nitrogen hydrolase family protein n=1 Tax=Paenibacillus hodogayensis TaxID=279208 RepID=A0ABV5VVH9_9BACL